MALQGTVAIELTERVRQALTGAGVPYAVYKGAHLVQSGAYRDPAARIMDDVDVLVPFDRADAAWRALAAAGFEPWREWDPELTPEWLDAAAFRDPALPPGMPRDVDLHWRIGYDTLRFGGGEGDSALLEAAVDGAPRPEDHWLVVAEHLLKHLRYRVHLPAYADLGRIAERVEDWDAVTGAIDGSTLAVPLRALLVVCRELGHPVPEGLDVGEALPTGGAGRANRPPPAAIVRMLRPATLLGRRAGAEGRVSGVLYRWRLVGSPSAVTRDLLRTAFPGRRWLRARYGGGGGAWPRLWARYLMDSLRWVAGRQNAPTSPDRHGPRP